MSELKEYTSTVILRFEGNWHEADSPEDYVLRLKESFYENFNIELIDSEITNIEEVQNA